MKEWAAREERKAEAVPEGMPTPDRPRRAPQLGNHALTLLMAEAQAKLEVGPAGDRYEREADEVARQVVHSLRRPLQPLPEDGAIARRVQRRPVVGARGGAVDPATERSLQAAGTGSPLPPVVRRKMEQAFGTDFSGVRVHTGQTAAALNHEMSAQAFTLGADIFLRDGMPDVHSDQGQELLAHELTHTIQQGGGVRRRFAVDRAKADFINDLTTNPTNRQLLDHIPSTGLGRFDAEYFVDRSELVITVKPCFQFGQTTSDGVFTPGGWLDPDKAKFIDDFRTQAIAAWSGKYAFQCSKAGWDDLRANVVIHVTPVDLPEAGTAIARISKRKEAGTGWGREQVTDRNNKNIGNFAAQDAPVRPHDSKSTCDNIAGHDVRRLQNSLTAAKVNPVLFETGGAIDGPSRGRLDDFVAAVKRTERPGSVPVPLIATGWGYSGNWEWMFGKTGSAQARATAVQSYLGGKAIKYPVETELFTTPLEAAKQRLASAKLESTKKTRKTELEGLQAQTSEQKVELSVKEDFSWTGDPYSIIAHEFGHMLGNPDEYFGYGSAAVRDAKVRQLTASGNPEDLVRAGQIEAQRPTGDASKTATQEPFAAAAETAGQTIPEFGPITSSIMSAGADVLPSHYLMLWEALGKITEDAIRPAEWKIV